MYTDENVTYIVTVQALKSQKKKNFCPSIIMLNDL